MNKKVFVTLKKSNNGIQRIIRSKNAIDLKHFKAKIMEDA